MKKWLTLFIALCVLLSLGVFIHTIDMYVVLDLVTVIGYKFILLLSVTFIAYLFGTISWQYALGQYSKSVSTWRLFLIRHIGETVGMFNPASILGGDVFKAVILNKYDIPAKNIASSLLLSRAIMVASQITLCATTALVLMHPSRNLNKAHLQQSGLYLTVLGNWKAFGAKLSRMFEDVPVMIRENKRMVVFSFIFALLHWVFGGLEFYFILKFLGLKVTMFEALVVDLGVVLFKAAGGFIPGQLGVEEYGNKIMLLAIGFPAEEIWVAASILRRGRQLFWIGFGVFVYFIFFQNSLNRRTDQ